MAKLVCLRRGDTNLGATIRRLAVTTLEANRSLKGKEHHCTTCGTVALKRALVNEDRCERRTRGTSERAIPGTRALGADGGAAVTRDPGIPRCTYVGAELGLGRSRIERSSSATKSTPFESFDIAPAAFGAGTPQRNV